MTFAAPGYNRQTELYEIFDVYQNTLIRTPKDIMISTLRDYFSKDSLYHYVHDEWGFPKTPSQINKDPYAGLQDNDTTRIFIGEYYRYDIKFYPAILVKAGSFRYIPISIDQNKYCIEYTNMVYTDGYGNRTVVTVPEAYSMYGAWEGSMSIEVLASSPRERDDIIETIAMLLVNIKWEDLMRAGIAIKPDLSIGGPSEQDDGVEKVFKQDITINYRGEWNRRVPINNIIETISLCVELGNLSTTPYQIADNLDIHDSFELIDYLGGI